MSEWDKDKADETAADNEEQKEPIAESVVPEGNNPEQSAGSPEDKDRAVRERAQKELVDKYEEAAGASDYLSLLESAVASYQRHEKFDVGDLVQWKPMLKSLMVPTYSRPAAIVGFVQPRELQRNVLFGNAEEELEDVYIGFLDGDLDLSIQRVNSRRLTAWDGGAA